MPRVSKDARPDRDELVVTLFLVGRSYREIGADPRVQLSPRGVALAVRRGLMTSPPPKHLLDTLLADAYAGSSRGDVRAKEQLRRLQQLLVGCRAYTGGARTGPCCLSSLRMHAKAQAAQCMTDGSQ